MDSGVPSLLQEIQELGQVVTSNPKNNDAESTQKLLSATRKLSIALQKPGILIEDFIYGVRASCAESYQWDTDQAPSLLAYGQRASEDSH